MVGKTFYTDNICHADDNPLGEMACVDDGQGGAFWGPFQLNQACNFSSLVESEISSSLLNLLVEDVNNTSIEKVLEQTNNITTDRNLTELDVLYMTDILEKTTQLQEITPQIASDIVKVYDTVVESAGETLIEAEEKGKVKNRILQTLDEVTSKLKPGPSGSNKIKTETFESEVWDLKSDNVTRLPVGLTLSESPSDANDSSSTLYNETVDYSKTDSAIVLPQEFLEGVVNGSKGKSIRLSMNLYRKPILFSKSQTASKRKGPILNSKVISAKILVGDEEVTHLGGTRVTFIFKSNEAETSAKHVCGYWNFTTGSWSTDGCNHTGIEAGRDVCVCDHLTNFAVLLDFDGSSEESAHHLPLTVITMVGLVLSMAGLSATVVTYLTFRKMLRKDPQQTLFHLSLSQLCAWTVFLAGFNQTHSHVGCILVAALLHYFIMASFLWMLAEAFLHYLLLVKVHASGTITPHYMWKTGVPAWGLPILPVIIVMAIDVNLYRGRELHCWMSWVTSVYAFALPIGLVLLCNLLLYLLLVFNICGKRKVGQKKSEHTRIMLNARVSFFCFILFGLSWVFGYLAVAEAKVLFQYIFCVTASTQGFLIFLLFTARNKQVRESWRKLCCRETMDGKRDILKMVSKSKSSGTSGTGTASVMTNETCTNVGSSSVVTNERSDGFGTTSI